MFYLLIFLFGLSIGSFLNVVICRLETEESILLSRSRCPHCGALLKWFDLIPLVSFLVQKRRCRYCGKKISWQYPLVELATGLLFLSVVLSALIVLGDLGAGSAKNLLLFVQNPSLVLGTIFYLVIICFLIIIFVYDLKHYLIPDKIVYPAIGLTFLYQLAFAFDFASLRSGSISGQSVGSLFSELAEGSNLFFLYLLSALLAAGFFLSLVLISKGKWMGLGDVKLAFLMGLILGWPNVLLALFLAFLSGAIIGLFLVILGRKGLKSQIPFGPFLSGAAIIIIISGRYLANFFQNFLPF